MVTAAFTDFLNTTKDGGSCETVGMNTHQQELPLDLRRRRRRRDSPAARMFFDLGDRLRREVEAEKMQRMRGRRSP